MNGRVLADTNKIIVFQLLVVLSAFYQQHKSTPICYNYLWNIFVVNVTCYMKDQWGDGA